ncbi:MAG: glycosyltransferase family 39 protein [Ignavibacteriales bacterium]|nr:MAG: hypothetical protein F9K26_01300 [Ignavibacteriaceae bacterium]MBW7872046.1 glycosyltransferase family 39 protein [Ignavibacteria bacterium]MCZ2143681.1 glycosyltransferase family 39 protein [Ignavibacteriales bacterium]OQY79714.1 MAG: hypothetical protein B6D45_00365 [Ignavibacteriales bacterium UTCHB3]MBV6446057.1 hypothetical protein [Ignavibacteriaceae bacterium]
MKVKAIFSYFKQSNVCQFLNRNSGKTIFSVSFLICIVYIYFAYNPNFLLLIGDSREYWLFSRRILEYGLFSPEVIKGDDILQILGPGYPLIMAVTQSIFGESPLAIFIVNAIFVSLGVVFVFKFVSENISISLGWVAAFLMVLNPQFYRYTTFYLKEPLVYFLFPLVIFFVARLIKRKGNAREIIGISVAFVYLIHTDERFFTYFFVFLVWAGFLAIKNRGHFRKDLLQIAVLVLVLMIPWGIRNYYIYDRVIILTTRTELITSVVFGKSQYTPESSYSSVFRKTVETIQKGIEPENVDREEVQLIKEALKQGKQPGEFGRFEKYLRAAVNFWQPMYISGQFVHDGFRYIKWSRWHNRTSLLFFGIFIPFFFIGMFYNFFVTKDKIILLLSLLPLINMFIHVALVHVLERYRSTTDFAVLIVALWVIWKLINRDMAFLKKVTAESQQ